MPERTEGMTVSRLIELLNKVPGHAEIWISESEGGGPNDGYYIPSSLNWSIDDVTEGVVYEDI